MAGGGTTLEYTPTWVVALVCTIIVLISLTVERILHYTGKVRHVHMYKFDINHFNFFPSFYIYIYIYRERERDIYFKFNTGVAQYYSTLLCYPHELISIFLFALQYLKKKNQKPLFEALQKIKEGGKLYIINELILTNGDIDDKINILIDY